MSQGSRTGFPRKLDDWFHHVGGCRGRQLSYPLELQKQRLFRSRDILINVYE